MKYGRGKPVWSSEEDETLLSACRGTMVSGDAAWQKVADLLPGRSFTAVRQRIITLRNKARGILRDPDRKDRPLKRKKSLAAEAVLSPPVSLPQHRTLTAFLFGDPLPGRSALDQKRSAGT